jgi:hypothetical protein
MTVIHWLELWGITAMLAAVFAFSCFHVGAEYDKRFGNEE